MKTTKYMSTLIGSAACAGNNRVATIKYMSTLIASTTLVHGTHYSFYHVVLVKFYCDMS